MTILPHQFQAVADQAAVGFLILFCISFSALLFIASRLRREQKKNSTLQRETTQFQVTIARLETQLLAERKSAAEKLALLEDAENHLNLQFQTLANRIFEEKSEKFSTENKERVLSLLRPLQEQLRGFQQRIEDIQVNDIRERSSLKNEILHLRDLNQQINKEAVNLTRALRGDKKKQGNWGELVLERVLAKSGLRSGYEYTVQKGYRNRDNRLLKPDVIIHLPERKDIIIDSKVPLSAWERYISTEQDEEKEALLKDHIKNIRNHVSDLSRKNYADLEGVRSLDFVLLFIPIDSSFTVATETDDKLYEDAYEQQIIIVTPTTLLATLKTIESLWRYEHQNRNAKEIADRAGAIYDKLRGFLEDMEKVGKQLATCSSTYDTAMNKLSRGRGNIISQAGKLTELGVKARKKIPNTISSLTESDTPN